MKSVGIRELKAHLSRYLEEVGRGELVLVTDRGRVVAEVRRPTVPQRPDQSPAERALSVLADRGVLRLGVRARPEAPPPTGLKVPNRTIDRLLAEARAEDDEG
ncbi:MAG: type II toxin-antitoxin system prevent-host-death family antitoxin [Deltaproteobacteria bacterium]|nr:type II toxin-antitoxin system prevent-host-death family antitoxin [Deltaproteobacteria bacterium]